MVGGVLVSNANLHNQDEINRLQIKVGSSVIVRRAGDVVPEIISVLDKPDVTAAFGAASTYNILAEHPVCPVCGSRIVRDVGQVDFYCSGGNDCPAQVQALWTNFAGRQGLNIYGLGDKVAEQLQKSGIKQFYQLFEMNYDQLKAATQLSDKLTSKLMKSIQAKREPDFGFLDPRGRDTHGRRRDR